MTFQSLQCCIYSFIASLSFAVLPAVAADKPNILLIMADDVGIEAFGCYGGTSYQTPNIDRLAAGGTRFTRAFSQPLCTPTRVQLMTGKYNHRNWRAFGILDPDERTFGHMMQDAGYATGIFGKWQLQSYDPPDFPGAADRRSTGMHPQDAGFDRYSLFHSLHTEDKGSRYANPTMLEGLADQSGRLKTYHGKYGPDVWVDQIVTFFNDHPDQPKFVYYPMALPHRPFVPTPRTKGWQDFAPADEDVRYATDMIQYTDVVVGRLLDQLAKQYHLANTIVIFYSDNGCHTAIRSQMTDPTGNVRTITGGKASPLQTGIHVPLIVSWPGKIAATVSDRLVDASDFVPTLLDLAGTKTPTDSELDGISFAPPLFGDTGRARQAIFVWYDPRPGWDKDQFGRHVFALDHDYKLFRDGRLFRLGDRPLEEILIPSDQLDDDDRRAKQKLAAVIDYALAGVSEPPLVDAFGNPLDGVHD